MTKNPYALDRNPSGSSSGTGAGVSANLAAGGIGTETDGSIVLPSSANGLVGIKTTVGLVSRSGIIPISHSQDGAGPMCRTVRDAATLRSDLQIEAEAEILELIRKLRAGAYQPPVDGMEFERSYFLSQSRILDRIPPADPISWTPEALYRYITALPGENVSPDLLQRCMLQEYFGAGIVLIDRARYEKFFGPSINAARTTYRKDFPPLALQSIPPLGQARRAATGVRVGGHPNDARFPKSVPTPPVPGNKTISRFRSHG